MRWPFRRRTGRPSLDAEAAAAHADRALLDVQALAGKVDRAVELAAEIKRVNHVAAAMVRVIKGA